jgi:hypothetical protein
MGSCALVPFACYGQRQRRSNLGIVSQDIGVDAFFQNESFQMSFSRVCPEPVLVK